MPIAHQAIGSTNPKTGTLQFQEGRIQGITLHIPTAAGVTSCTNNRIVTLQEDANGNRYAVLHPVAVTRNSIPLTIIGWGVLEEALQAGGISSIAPTPNTYVDGDTVTVLRDLSTSYAIDYEPGYAPTVGIQTARVDAQGRLTSVAAGAYGSYPVQLYGSVFKSVPGNQMANQLKTGCLFYQMSTALVP